MQTVDLGSVRLHVLAVFPGFPGEGERATSAIRSLDPALVLADVDAQDALRLRAAAGERKARFEPGFVDALFEEEAARRYAPDGAGDHPLLAAARSARDRHIDFVPMRPLAKPPGFFARRRARRAAREAAAAGAGEFPAAFAKALADARAWDPAPEAEGARRRIEQALREGRAPVLVLVQAHRAPDVLARVHQLGRVSL